MHPTPSSESDNRNRTRAEVDEILARLDQSGLTAAAFSRREDLNLTTLPDWKMSRIHELTPRNWQRTFAPNSLT